MSDLKMKVSKHNKVLIVSPHPDDGELGAGGMISLFVRQGYDVISIYLTRGECGGAKAKVREKESINACLCLGISENNIHFGPFADTRIPDTYDSIEFLERYIDDRVHTALIPSTHDFHQDHRKTAYSAITAFRNVPCLLSYESPSSMPSFNPNTFVDISELFDCKWKCLKCHKSQIAQDKIFLEYQSIMNLAAFRGRQAGVFQAEAFECIKNRLMILPLVDN